MSTVMKLPGKGYGYIYLMYDFTQVRDTILLIFYAQKRTAWKKIFINYKNGSLDTGRLQRYVSNDAYAKICSSLQEVFKNDEVKNEHSTKMSEVMMPERVPALLGMCS